MQVSSHTEFMLKLFVVGLLFFSSRPALADEGAKESGPRFNGFEKIAVFPILYGGSEASSINAAGGPASSGESALGKSLDEAWWQIREELTDTGRFVVASRGFLQRSDAFQPRGDLSTADAVILGRFVEADALITLKLSGRTISMTVWETKDGSVAWRESVDLHPSVLVRDQIARVARGLTREFVAQLPYHGVVVTDALSRKLVFDNGGSKAVRVKVGSQLKIEPGDRAQLIVIHRGGLGPLFLPASSTVRVIASGRVKTIEKEALLIDLDHIEDARALSDGGLVAFPAEIARQATRGSKQAVVSQLAMQILEPSKAVSSEIGKNETRPLATTLSVIGSLAGLLLLAF